MRLVLFAIFLSVTSGLMAQSAAVQAPDTLRERDVHFTQGRKTALMLAILTGPIGGHRIYLGTAPAVPFFYVLTLGGGLGLLPLIDIFHILFSKDFEQYLQNDRVLMWTRKSPG